MSLHHHHIFDFGEDDKPVYFDGVLVHDHADDDHWEQDAFYRVHRPFGGHIDDSNCNPDDPCALAGRVVVPTEGSEE